MATVVRLTRMGRNKTPFYRIVVQTVEKNVTVVQSRLSVIIIH